MPWGGVLGQVHPGKTLPYCPAPSPIKNAKLVLSMRTQMPKQKNRLPSTYGKRREGVCGQSRATVALGPLPGSHE